MPIEPTNAGPAIGPPAGAPPTTRRDDVHDTMHGVDIVDPYRRPELPILNKWFHDESAELALLVWQLD